MLRECCKIECFTDFPKRWRGKSLKKGWRPASSPLMKNEKGFTLIELMVVLVIMGILVTVVVVKFTDQPENARVLKTKSDIKNVETALKMFKVHNGFYPSTEQGIEALVSMPNVGRQATSYQEGGYLEAIPTDPWGSPYAYFSPGVKGHDYEIISYGADGIEGGEGFDKDIESWRLN